MKKETIFNVLLIVVFLVATAINIGNKTKYKQKLEQTMELTMELDSLVLVQLNVLSVKIDSLEKIEYPIVPDLSHELVKLQKQVKTNTNMLHENCEDIFRLHRWHNDKVIE